jgi:transcriptional regulator MraZ
VETQRLLVGEYEHTIDDKHRLTLPARFRQAFADGAILSRGLDGCVDAYRREDWARSVESRLAALDPFGEAGRRLRRYYFGGAAEADLDRQGRVIVPAHLIGYAKLEREVVVIGMHDHLEIWDRAAWRRELERFEGSAEDVAERLAAQHD